MGDNTYDEYGYLCPVCGLDFETEKEFNRHRQTEKHRSRWLEASYKKDRLTYISDKNGIKIEVVSNNLRIKYFEATNIVAIQTENWNNDADCPYAANLDDDRLMFSLLVINRGYESFYFTSIDQLVGRSSLFEMKDQYDMETKHNENVIVLAPGKSYNVTCIVRPEILAKALHIPVLFEFYPITKDKNEENLSFYVGKTIEIYGAATTVRNFGDYVPGVYPTYVFSENINSKLEQVLPLWSYNIPPWFLILAYNNNANHIKRSMKISEHVSFQTYAKYFKTLLWLEELQQEMDIQFYSRKKEKLIFPNSNIERYRNCVALKVEGLSENRPSLIVRDSVFVRPSEGASKTWYQGIVHNVECSKVYLGFNEIFVRLFDENTEFDVEFTNSRYTLRVCHRAVNLCEETNLNTFLFPKKKKVQEKYPHLPHINLYDHDINEEQLRAVQNIVAGNSGNSPYIVFGPPGTGKTVTIVEAIKQVLYMIPGSNVLACAPSNTAADLIAEKLLQHFDEKHVYRIYAARCSDMSNRSEKVLKASNYSLCDMRVTYPPARSFLMKKRVIVTTFATAASWILKQRRSLIDTDKQKNTGAGGWKLVIKKTG